MSGKLKGMLGNKLLAGIVFLAIGIGMICVPDAYINTFVRIAGILLLVVAIFRGIGFIRSEKKAMDVLRLIVGIVIAAFGISFLANPAWVIKFIYIIFGALVILEGVTGIYNAIAVLRKNELPWIPFAVSSLIVTALGVIIVMNPFETVPVLQEN